MKRIDDNRRNRIKRSIARGIHSKAQIAATFKVSKATVERLSAEHEQEKRAAAYARKYPPKPRPVSSVNVVRRPEEANAPAALGRFQAVLLDQTMSVIFDVRTPLPELFARVADAVHAAKVRT